MANNKKVIDINSDENADWIKLVRNGKNQKKELAIHEKLDKTSKDNTDGE